MFERVLGVDPGVASVGLAVLERDGGDSRILWSDTLHTSSAQADSERLRSVYRAVREAIAAHEVPALAVERLMWGKNVGSAMKVARASGVILLAAADAGVSVEEYAPLEVKMAATGVGNASKDQVRRTLERAHRIEGMPTQPDAADAVAVAFCHLQQSKMRTLARQALSR